MATSPSQSPPQSPPQTPSQSPSQSLSPSSKGSSSSPGTSVPPPPSTSFGEQMTCPVCFEMYDVKIVQCTQGHSVCDKCKKKLVECPQCRGTYGVNATRNYLMEEIMKQFRFLKELSEHHGDADGGNSRLVEALVRVVESMPKPSRRYPDEESDHGDVQPLQQPVITNDQDDDPFALVVRHVVAMNGPPQPRGKFACRICDDRIPVCRMLNHLRCHHDSQTTVTRLSAGPNDEFFMHYTFQCNPFRQAIHISQYGIFFLIVNVKEEQGQTTITAWIQCVGRSTECKLYIFNLQMRIGNDIAHYEDYTYGDSSDFNYIERRQQCLVYKTHVAPNRIDDIAVDVKIAKTDAERNGRRRSNTIIVPINI